MRNRRLLVLTAAYGIALAMVAFWRTPIDRNVPVVRLPPAVWMQDGLGLTITQSYHAVEAGANVVLFVPLGALVVLWRRDWTWLHAAVIAFSTTALIETAQQVLRPERFAAVSDLVANTLGGAIGALLVMTVRSVARRRVVRQR
jgi:glycopeptide antibiotics resistance protein